MIPSGRSSNVDYTITLCICSFNRAESLRRTLESVAAQQECEGPVEILVIDNNSSDHTREVVAEFSDRVALRYVFEQDQGLSRARNRALKEFRGRYLLFTDDDVRLAPDWIKSFEAAIVAYPDADYFGGRILPDWVGEKPAWIAERPLHLIDGLLGWMDLGVETRPFGANESGPNGASFAFSRRLADRVGLFGADLGCVGRMRGRGEESDWIARARALGARGVYVGAAACWHRVDGASLTLRRLFSYGVHSGRAIQKIRGDEGDSAIYRFASFAVRGLWQLLRGRGDRFRQCVINMGIVFGAAAASRVSGEAPDLGPSQGAGGE
jgi:GT2 family glycosyltransferase